MRRFLIFDFTLSFLLGLISWLVSRDGLLSLLVSLVSGLIFLVVEMRYQVATLRRETRDSIGLVSAVANDKAASSAIQDIVGGYVVASTSGNDVVRARARESLVQAATSMSRMLAGEMTLDSNATVATAIALMKASRRMVVATSLVNDGGFWLRGHGQEYAAENRRAIERGVEIRRVFLAPRIDAHEVQKVTQEQAAMGVAVRTLALDHVSGEDQLDFCVYDDDVVLFCDVAPSTREIRGGRLVFDPAQVRSALALHSRLYVEGGPLR